MTIKKCPFCNNNIRIYEHKFPIINDKGGIIIECDKCFENSYTKALNPDELSISLGGKKIDTWDSQVTQDFDFLKNYPDIKELVEGINVIGEINNREYKFNFQKPHIYKCSKCKREIETISKESLEENFKGISNQYNILINFVIANGGWERENLVVEVKSECICGEKFISYWHKNHESNFENLTIDELHLIGTNMPLDNDYIDGVHSKNDCIRILEKFIIRWNAIFPRLLIVTPFVGHQWMSDEQLVELWDWIKNFLDPHKSTLVTRTSTFNKYKKASKELGIDLDLLDDFGINNPIIEDYTKKQDFHAKIYIGYSQKNSEILMGSFNLLNGPSMENISFKQSNYKSFFERFIEPMNIQLSEPDEIEKNWSHIYQDEKGGWNAGDVASKKVLNEIAGYN